MKRALLIGLFAACGPGNRDAPRPVGPYPNTDFKDQSELAVPVDDDDGDGIPNDQDGCPLAAEKWDDPVRDGCPMFALDAGVTPVKPVP